jgi:hypothetical protein
VTAPDAGASPDLTPADLRAAAEDIRREFPLVATRSTLVLFDVDPTQVQAQWQITDAALASALGAFPAGASQVRPLLRLRQIAGDGSSQELAALPQPARAGELNGVARFRVAEAGVELEAELGLASAEGGWLLLARSNRVRLPTAPQPNMPPDARGPLPPPSAGRGVAVPARAAAALPSADPQAMEGDLRSETVPPRTQGPAGAQAPALDGGPPPVQAVDLAGEPIIEPALTASGAPLAPVFPLCWSDPAAAGRYLRLIAQTQPEEPTVASPLPEAGQPPSEPVASDPGSWAELPPPILPSAPVGGASGPWSPFGPAGGLSSVDLHARGPAPDFEIHAELYLWGRAGPDSLVAVFGRPIRVGPDGRFSLRLALRDPEVLAQALAKGEPPGPSDA